MPEGRYLLDGGAEERFACGPTGDGGWRYEAERTPGGLALDLTVDAAWRTVRLAASGGGWDLRGGALGPELHWRRGTDEQRAEAACFSGDSPGLLVACARLLALDVGEQRRVAVVRLSPALAPLTVEEGWGRTPDVEEAARYEVADLATAQRRVLHLVGDVVVEGTGVRLLDLSGAPTLTLL